MAGNTSADRAALERAARHLDSNEAVEAERILAPLLEREPHQAQALHLLGVVRMQLGHMKDAEAFYRRSLDIAPDQPQLRNNLAILLSKSGRFAEAIAQLREAVQLKPNYADAHLNLALALSSAGDHASAERSCRDALRYQPNLLTAKQVLATELCVLGRPNEAEKLVRRTLQAGLPDRRSAAALENTLALALKQQERFEEALAHFDAAQRAWPEILAVDCNRAGTLDMLGRFDEAAKAYAHAVARDPAHVDALAGLALTSALTNDFARAETAGERAAALAADNVSALTALAIVDTEREEFSAAEMKLRRVIDDPNFRSGWQATYVVPHAADALARHGQSAAAFEVYATANSARRAMQALPEAGRIAPDIERWSRYFTGCAPWPASASSDSPRRAAAGHVFLLGFMRSGTTLLQTILSANPLVTSIDEIEFLTEPSREFLLSEEGIVRLSTLDAAQIERWQNAYWKSVSQAGISVEGKVFVDKMPFNVLRLPLIARLFPDAKVIFAVRDPRDVVFSCFRRRFNPTPFAYEFLDLGDCARFYASTMALVSLYRKKLPIAVHEHRYEDMIADFDTVVRAACDFSGIAWDPAMQDFSSAARDLDRRSASAAQVARGLYADGVGQWRAFREQLAPVLPLLEPWIARYGYPAD